MGVRYLLCASQIGDDGWSKPQDGPVEAERKPVISLNPTEGSPKSWNVVLGLIACVCRIIFTPCLNRHFYVGRNRVRQWSTKC